MEPEEEEEHLMQSPQVVEQVVVDVVIPLYLHPYRDVRVRLHVHVCVCESVSVSVHVSADAEILLGVGEDESMLVRILMRQREEFL